MEASITIIVNIPEDIDITRKELQEWAEFRTGYRADLKADNPLADEDLEAISVRVSY